MSDFGATASIAAHGFFLIAPPDPDYDGPTADKTYTNTTERIAANNTIFLYSDAGITLIDKVAWGTGASLNPEGTATANPANNGSIERKASCSSSTASLGSDGVEENAGNGQDTDNNLADFVQQTASNPQNTSNSSENDTPIPDPTADAGPAQEICLGGSVQIGGSPTGGTAPYTFVWSPSTGLDDATAENPNASPTSTTTYTVEVTDANGCKDTDAVTVTVRDDGPQPVHQMVFLADNGIFLDRHGASEGNLHSNEDVDVKDGAPSTLTGDLTAVDDIRIEEDNTIDGDVTAGDDLQVDDGVTITGTPTGNASVSPVALPTLSFITGGANQTVPPNGSLTLAPDSYGNVKVNRNGTLNLSSGDYYLKKLELKAAAILVADVSDGPVKIHVENKLSFDKNVQVIITPGGESNTARLTFEFLGGARVSLGEQARVLGNIIAPEATVELKKNSRFKGSICAELINVKEGAVFFHHTSSTPLPAKQNTPEDIEDIDSEEQITSLPIEYELAPNYPNPFNPSTTIKFALPEAGRVTLKIFASNGQLVRTLVEGEMPSGRHSPAWNGRNRWGVPVASGLYFYQIVVQKSNGEIAFTETRRMTLVK